MKNVHFTGLRYASAELAKSVDEELCQLPQPVTVALIAEKIRRASPPAPHDMVSLRLASRQQAF